jgi:formyl-CoA transferase
MDTQVYPLADVRVVEFGQYISAPCAGVLLAEMGADVIKVESPEGDPFRQWEGDGLNGTFVAFNRGKRSVVADLKRASDKKRIGELVADADVLIENFRPGVMDRLGLAYEDVRARNPRLVYCSVSGFGSTGPYAAMPAFDSVASGYSGLAALLLDEDEPRLRGPALADAITGHSAAFAVLAALHFRERSGVGQHLAISMLGATSHFLHSAIAKFVVEGQDEGSDGRVRASQAYAFTASDGERLVIHLSSPAKFWIALCQAIGRSDLLEDPRFTDRPQRVENYEILSSELSDVFRARPRHVWLKALQQHGVPCAPVNRMEEVLADPQLRHLGIFGVDTSGSRPMPQIRPPVHFNGRILPPIARAPMLGEHTEAVAGEPGTVWQQDNRPAWQVAGDHHG